jgi:hypothetical protein
MTQTNLIQLFRFAHSTAQNTTRTISALALITSALLTVATTAHAGPSVSGGITQPLFVLLCEPSSQGSSFFIRTSSDPTHVGVLTEGQSNSQLSCRATTGAFAYSCDELRPGEGQLHVNVEKGSGRHATAYVSRKNIIQQLTQVDQLSCEAPQTSGAQF